MSFFGTQPRMTHVPPIRYSSAKPTFAPSAAATRAAGAEFGVIAFPHEGQVSGDVSARLQRDLVELGEEGGWQTIDLLPELRRAAGAGGAELYFDLWHPTPAGHAVAARALAAELRAAGAAADPEMGSFRNFVFARAVVPRDPKRGTAFHVGLAGPSPLPSMGM